MEGCLFTAGASRVCPDFHRIGLLSILSSSHLSSLLMSRPICQFQFLEWKAHRLSVNYASGCAVWLRILLIVEFCYLLNFANFPAFYLGYSIQCSLCVELLQVSVESRQLWTMKSWISMINEEEHVSRKLHVEKGWLVADQWVNLVTTRLWVVLRITESNYRQYYLCWNARRKKKY